MESNTEECTSTGESSLTDKILYNSLTTGPCGIIHTPSSLSKRSIFSKKGESLSQHKGFFFKGTHFFFFQDSAEK